MNLYKTNRATENPGLALLPKLKYEHVYLTSYSKMRVDLAAQVITAMCAENMYTCTYTVVAYV